MDERIMEKLGLTKGEISVYLALNKLGETTVGHIGKESKVSKSKIYDILEKLIEKGLVGCIIKEGTKYFVANDPKMIVEYAAKKEEEATQVKHELEKILPLLSMQRQSVEKQRTAELYAGFHGLKTIREELLSRMKKGDKLLVLGAPKIANEKFESWLLDFHTNRIKKGIGMKIIYNSDAKPYGKIRKKWKLTEVRYLPNNMVSPSWIDIFTGAVLFAVLIPKPIAFIVRDKELSRSFANYFDIVWNNSLKK